MGICFTAEDDDRLARGWPYLIVPVDGLKADKTPAAAEKAWSAGDPIYFTEWPRRTLHRFMHAAMASLLNKGEAAIAALENDDVPTPRDSLDALRRVFRTGYATYPFKERDFVWGVETVAGSDATLETIADEVDAFEAATDDPDADGYVRNPACRAAIVEAAAFLLLRAAPAVAASARKRLERAFSATRDPSVTQGYAAFFGALDYVLHGAEGVRREKAKWPKSPVKLEVWALGCSATLDFATGDPAFVQEQVASSEKKGPMSVRIPVLGGTSVLRGLEARKWPAAQLPSVVRDFGMIRAPEVVALMTSLVGKSAVKDAPLEWLQAHAEYARPILEKTKSEASKLVLRQLG